MHDELLGIGEVAQRAGVATSALRYYEELGLIEAERTPGARRAFRRDVLRRLAFIQAAQRVGLTLSEVADALGSLPKGRTPTKADWARLSRGWRARLDAEIATLERLRDDLTSCIGCGCLSLRACALYNPDDHAAAFGTGARYLAETTSAEVLADLEPGRRPAAGG